MAIIEGGASGALIDVGSNTKAARVEVRPTDVGSLGSYIVAASSGTMAAGLAGAATIFSVRWGDSTRAMVVRRVGLTARNLTTAFAAGVFLFELMQARSFSASDSGGSAITLTGNNAKRRTSFGSSLVTDMRISTTGTLTAGTRTLDGNAAQLIRGNVPATAVNYPFVGLGCANIPGASTGAYSTEWQNLFEMDIATEWPLVFVQNEGFIIRATVPATGTWTFDVLVEWSEVATTAGFN
jgi:hypothetical protein